MCLTASGKRMLFPIAKKTTESLLVLMVEISIGSMVQWVYFVKLMLCSVKVQGKEGNLGG